MRARPKTGDRLPALSLTTSQAVIDAYASASGDFKPIHVDAVYGENGPYGRTIAHGLMTIALVGQVLNDWSDGTFDESGEIDVTFVAPVFVGDILRVSGFVEEIVEANDMVHARVELDCTANGRKVLAGTAIQPLRSTD